MTRRLLSLDLSGVVGWAACDTQEGEPVFGRHILPKTGEELGPYLVAYHHWLVSLLEEQDPDLIVMEAPISSAGATTMITIKKLYNLYGHTEYVATNRGIRCLELAGGTWKRAFTGSGKVSKKMKPYPVTEACELRGWKPFDHNEADALGMMVAALGMIKGADAARFDPLMRAAA